MTLANQFSDLQQDLSSPFEDLTSLRLFVRTVEVGSFSEVARRINVTPAMVSKRIASLESRLNQRLLNRNTRRLVVTDAGQLLYEHAVRALSELDQSAAEMSDLHIQPTGHLRITAPLLLGTFCIAPRLPDFLKQYPSLSLEVNFSIEKLDLFEQRIDVAVRIAVAVDPGLIAIKLAPYHRVFCASPDYLAEHGIPKKPEDLTHHNCLVSRGSILNNQWEIRNGSALDQVSVKGNLRTDSSELVHRAAIAGLGIMMGARWRIEDDLRSGTLVEVLAGFVPDNRAIYAVLLQRSDSSRRLAHMVEFLKDCFADLN